jgi:hypothetical protein
MEEEEYLQCPSCQCFWTLEEIDEQRCGACGFPENDDDEMESTDWWQYPDESDEDYLWRTCGLG